MSAGTRLLAFGAGLAVLLVAGFAAGRLFDAAPPGASAAQEDGADAGHGEEPGSHGEEASHGAAIDPVRGLAVAENGLRLLVADPDRALGVAEPLRFRILGEDGEAIAAFDRIHTKRMHLIVVRRDLTGFQHLHPRMAADGTWTAPLRLPEAGTYRLFADFSHEGEARTLADDLRVDGAADLRRLPPVSRRAFATPGDLEVTARSADAAASEEAGLRFEVRDGGRPVALQSYLGAGGHLVALREGDLAFLHVHPTGDAGGDGSIEFGATFPTSGRYRLFLQFKVDGVVRTAAFTELVS